MKEGTVPVMQDATIGMVFEGRKGVSRERHIHTIEPVFDQHSRVLLLGTFPSPKSRELGFFYGHPQNRMWRVLARVTGEDAAPQTIAERREFLLRSRIAMWDVLASCTIEGAADSSIRNCVPNDISCILEVAPIEEIYTTGAKATELYRRFLLPKTGRDCASLPSTSAANASESLEDLVSAYSIICPQNKAFASG